MQVVRRYQQWVPELGEQCSNSCRICHKVSKLTGALAVVFAHWIARKHDAWYGSYVVHRHLTVWCGACGVCVVRVDCDSCVHAHFSGRTGPTCWAYPDSEYPIPSLTIAVPCDYTAHRLTLWLTLFHSHHCMTVLMIGVQGQTPDELHRGVGPWTDFTQPSVTEQRTHFGMWSVIVFTCHTKKHVPCVYTTTAIRVHPHIDTPHIL